MKEFSINLPNGGKQLFDAFQLAEEQAEAEERKEFAAPQVTGLATYPVDVWDGTLYGEFAELCTQDNYIAKELFIEGLKTVVGAIVGNQLRCDKKGIYARQDTIAVAPPGSGKDTAFDAAQEPFRCYEDFDVDGKPRPYLSNNDVSYKHIGAKIVNAASENALIDAANVCPRVLLIPPELGSLISKGQVTGAGASLLDVIRRSYDYRFPNFSTAERRKKVPEIMERSMLTSIQPDTLDNFGMGSGLPSRVTWVVPPPLKPVASIGNADLGDWPVKMFGKLLALEANAITIKTSREAQVVLDEWFAKVKAKEYENEIAVRINIFVQRNALHLAWLRDVSAFTPEVMGDATRLGDWQLSIRDSLFVQDTNNDVARYQLKIISRLRQFGPTTKNKLYRAINASSVGTEIFDRALKGLIESKQVKAFPSARRNQTIYGIPKENEQ